MNRSLLLIICDFLLLSFLALARFDVVPSSAEAEVLDEEAIPLVTLQEDLADLLRGSLEAEEAERRALEAALARAREEQEAQARAAEEALRLRDADQEALTESLRQREAELAASARTLTERQEELRQIEERRRTAEERQATLEADLVRRDRDALLVQERLRAAEEALRRREESLTQTDQERRELEAARRQVEEEKRQLSTRLEVAEAERRLLEANLANARTEVEIERRERDAVRREADVLREQTTRLVADVSVLAEASTEIRQEIQGLQVKTASAIFQDYLDRRVEITFSATYRGVFSNREREFRHSAVMVGDGERSFIVLHTRDTPFAPRLNPSNILSLRGQLRIGDRQFSIREASLLRTDPRFLVIPLGRTLVEDAGGRPFALAAEPFRFREIILINRGETYFGESSFQVVPNQPDRIEIPRQILSRLFGEINASPGDWVFSQGGDLLGVMVDNRQALLLGDFAAAERIPLGDQFAAESFDNLLLRLGARFR